ncbi:hypothetical protein SAMN05660649_00402 [Desulfotomaculum arcticum]|uniref:Uncharacterized protein n=1 Tax=Desulfotruncus arcticus DSM 17038 TaxID=1121424 RepID=A0A1I2N7F1_9FIRM|nr:hypothetical protein [Desulfotruncus arcticus]SFF99682.1 hypothetical protein SAMN05660649_00402 [Desulfotomaculum arcticum] [Desulfotruncus arcticus DSM 17038]
MQTANVLDFPSVEDQQVIQTAVQTFLLTQTGRTRELMLKTIRAVLDRYRITKFGFADYYVYVTNEPKWSVIRAKKIIEGQVCPGCGINIYNFKSTVRILGIQELPKKHFVTYGCKCGSVFGKWELFLN